MRFGLALAMTSFLGCGAGGIRAMVAENGDLHDYRSFRTAETRGERLRFASDYLAEHPRGAWHDEVAAAFRDEEPLYYEAAQSSRNGVSDYVAHLPRGPHAEAAIALLIAFDMKVESAEMARLLREARRSEAKLARASEQRREVSEAILGVVAALLERSVYDASIQDAPPLLRRSLGGEAPSTWGTPPSTHERDLFYSIPTHLDRQSRVLTLEVAVESKEGRVVWGTISAPDLFILWTEADQMKLFDPTVLDHRVLAANHAIEVLGGAFEAALPAARCRVGATGRELFMRRCDGWLVWAQMGDRAGTVDSIHIGRP